MRLKTVPGFTRLSVIVCCCTIVLAACGGSSAVPAGKNTGNQPVAAPPDKQILRMPAEGGDFATLDPALTALTGEPMNIIFTGLVGLKADGTVGDQLAASHEVSADGLTYTFKLKPNLKFSDGSPLTADDVAYSINRAVSPATKSNVRTYLNMLKDFDKITSGKIPTLIGDSLIVKDPSTISIVLGKPAAYFLQALTYPTSYVVQRKLIEQYGDKWTDHLNEGGGAGPFKVESYSHTTGLVLVPNPNYYGPKPKLQKVQFVIASDRDSNYRAFRAGQYDIALVPPSQIEFASKQAGFQSIPSLTTNYIGLNYLAKPFDNIKIRQAFALAIDKELIAKRIIGNASIASNHIVLKGMAGYNENLMGPAGVTSLAGDQEKAKQLFQEGLQEAGYGSVDKLPSLSLAHILTTKAQVDTITAVAQEWKQVLDVDVRLVGLQPSELFKQTVQTVGHEGPLQMWYAPRAVIYPDPQYCLTLVFGKGSGFNAVNYGQNHSANAAEQQAVQAQLAQADAESDVAARMKLYNDAEQKIVNDVAWIPMLQGTFAYAVNPKLQNWKRTPWIVIATDDWSNVYFAQ